MGKRVDKMSEEWFNWYVKQSSKNKDWARFKGRYLCPCCYMPTLEERAIWDICAICFWEDDGQDSDDSDVVRGGPNSNYSLTEARNNFIKHQTMYRPSDTSHYERERSQFEFKQSLYSAYKKAIETDSNDELDSAIKMHEEYYEDEE